MEPTVPESNETLECRADDGSWQHLEVSFSPAAQSVPFRCIRFENAADSVADSVADSQGSRAQHVVNITGESVSGQLQIALHEIKTKHFLQGRPLAIVSDGKNFGAIERECVAMRAAGIDDVTAVIPAKTGAIPRMSAREFIAERAYGVWRFENHTSQPELESPLFSAAANPEIDFSEQRQGSVGLVRTLVVYDNHAEEAGNLPTTGAGQVFILEGGLEGLKQYEQEAAAMARAQARPRISERGCAS